MTEPFRVLVADPPWKFNDALPGNTRGASKQYECMRTWDICNFQLPPLADDCVLFLWRVASMQQAALDVAAAWGFCVKSEIVWLKKTVHGNRWFGMGRIVRAEHEICLIGTRRRPQVQNHSVRSTFVTEFDGLSAVVERHSQKPEKFYEIVESLYTGPYVELFARRQRPGWTCLGNEIVEPCACGCGQVGLMEEIHAEDFRYEER